MLKAFSQWDSKGMYPFGGGSGSPKRRRLFGVKVRRQSLHKKMKISGQVGFRPRSLHLAGLQASKRFSARDTAKPVINWLNDKGFQPRRRRHGRQNSQGFRPAHRGQRHGQIEQPAGERRKVAQGLHVKRREEYHDELRHVDEHRSRAAGREHAVP